MGHFGVDYRQEGLSALAASLDQVVHLRLRFFALDLTVLDQLLHQLFRSSLGQLGQGGPSIEIAPEWIVVGHGPRITTVQLRVGDWVVSPLLLPWFSGGPDTGRPARRSPWPDEPREHR